jgi:LCP family protein required for cell wall assembly
MDRRRDGERSRGRRTGARILVAVLVLALLPLAGFAGMVARADAATGRVLTVLLMGSDQGPPRSGDPARGRADGFQLLFVSPDRQHATFVSVPRDSWVPVSGRGTTRINSCLTSGPQNCVSTVESLWGIDVDGWAVTSMWGFADAVSAFGGLVTESCGGLPLTSRGLQALNGHEVLTFARNRKQRSGGDFARTRAQAEALAVGQAHLYARGTDAAAAQVASIVGTYAQTSFSAAELGAYALQALRLPPGNVRRIGLPATAGWAGAASVVFLGDGAGAIFADAAADGIVGNPERIGVGARGPDALGPSSVAASTSATAGAGAGSSAAGSSGTTRPATTAPATPAAPAVDPVPTAVPDADLAVATPFVRGPAVTRLQRALAAQGMDVTADGVYGPQTARAVALLQSRTGRRVDGVVTRELWDRLFPGE